MGTMHINYKSDFLLRERFYTADKKPTALPAECDFRLMYYTKPGVGYEASRVGGVYTNCYPDGESVIVIFSDAQLGIGPLHHELRLSLPNAAFPNGVQNIYIPEHIGIELWGQKSDTENIIECSLIAAYTKGDKGDKGNKGDKGDKGDRGAAFRWEDFTPAQLAALKGDKGDAFRWEDFTATQIERLQAPATQAAAECRNVTAAASQATEDSRHTTAASQAATGRAEAEIVRMQQMEAQVERAASMIPLALRVEYPRRITCGNDRALRITARLLPDYVMQNVLVLGDDRAVETAPDGTIKVLGVGVSRVHVIPSANTALYKTLRIEVVAPTLVRTSATGVLLTTRGNMILT